MAGSQPRAFLYLYRAIVIIGTMHQFILLFFLRYQKSLCVRSRVCLSAAHEPLNKYGTGSLLQKASKS